MTGLFFRKHGPLAVTMVCGAAAVLALAGCGSSGGSAGGAPASGSGRADAKQSLTNVKLGFTSAAAFGNAPVWVAQELGYFKKQGLNVSTIVLASSTIALPALVSGDIQFSAAATIPLFSAVTKGLPVKAFAGTYYGLPGIGMVVKPDLVGKLGLTGNINHDLKQLKGKVIGVESPSATSGKSLTGLLIGAGLPTNWVKMVSLKAGPTQIAALQHGVIDGFLDNVPNTLIAQDKKVGKIDFTLKAVPELQGAMYTCIISSSSYISGHAKTVREFKAALVEAEKALAAHDPAALKAADKYLGGVSAAEVNPYLSLDIDADGSLTTASVQKMADVANQWKLTPSPITAADVAKGIATGY